MYQKFFKGLIDFILSLCATIILSPVMLIIAIAIKIDSKGPVLFFQERLGKDGKVFKIIKFRTMVVNAENIGDGIDVKSDKDDRITRVGKFLRKTSLDELPQFINILKGDMSLIGPRPPVTYHPHKYEEYPENQKRRFCIRPGITGLAQIRVRNNATWDERIEIDLEYIDNISFLKDVKIFILTFFKIFKEEQIYKNN